MRYRVWRFVLLCSVFVAGAGSCGRAMAAYQIQGDLNASAAGGQSISRDVLPKPVTSLADSGTSTGTYGNYAYGAYFADLSTATLGTIVHGYGVRTDAAEAGGASLEVMVAFADSLTVTIPVGFYPDDLYVSVRGHVEGSLSARGSDGSRHSSVYQIYRFRLGGTLGSMEEYLPIDVEDGEAPISHSKDFTLSARVLYGGTTLTSPRDAVLVVSAFLKGRGGALATYPPNGDATTEIVADFYNTGSFTSVEVPQGATWVSDSGVFLPEPGTLSVVLLGASVLVRRRRR